MQIDYDQQGSPRAMLVSVSLAPKPGPDGKYFTVFIPIGEIIKLRHVSRVLAGHPWLDVPDNEIIGLDISRADHRFISRHLKAGRFIAIRAVGRRGKKSKGCRLGSNGQPLVNYRFGWRKRERYITDPIDILWLEEFSKESGRYADKVFLIEAIAEYFRRLSDRLARMPKPPRQKRNG